MNRSLLYRLPVIITLIMAGSSLYAQLVYTIPQKAGDFNRQAYIEITEDALPDPVSCTSNETQFYKIKFNASRIVKFLAHTDTITQNEDVWDDNSTPEVNHSFNNDNPELLDRLKKENLSEKEDIYKLLMPKLDNFINDKLVTTGYYICKEDCDVPLYICGINYMEHVIEESDFGSRLELGITSTLNDVPPYKIERNWILRFDYEGWVYFELTCGCGLDESLVSSPSPSQNPEELLISVHDVNSDIVWYNDVVFDSDKKPDPLPCSNNQRQFFRNKIQFEKVYKNYRKDTVETNKKKWRIKDADEFDRKNNEENAEDLKNDEAQDVDRLDINGMIEEADATIEDSIYRHWWNNEFAICIDDCDWAQCTWVKEITFIKDPEITYKYKARSADIDTAHGKPYSAIVHSDLIVTYEGLIYFWIGCFCNEDHHMSIGPEPMDYDAEFWEPIQLTGKVAKPFLSSTGRFPYWIPVTGGAVIGGVIYWLATKEEDITSGAIDDFITLDCFASGSINVLDNDKGKELTLDNVEVHSGSGDFTFDSSGRIVITNATGNFILSYTATDGKGRSISGTLTVNVLGALIDAIDDTYQVKKNQFLVGNILDNDLGDNLVIVDHNEPANKSFNLAPSGLFTFTPETNFTGSTSFKYTVQGQCDAIDSAQVIIEVMDSCIFEAMGNGTDENCNAEDGSVIVHVTPPENYTYSWETGDTTSEITGLSAGLYTVTITDPDQNCEKVYDFRVQRSLVNQFIFDTIVEPVSCLTGQGEIILELFSPGNGDFVIDVLRPSGSEQVRTTETTVNLSDHIDVTAGPYELLIHDESLGRECRENLHLRVSDHRPEIQATDDQYIISSSETLTENVLINDEGAGLQIHSFDVPSFGIADITTDGGLTYTPDKNYVGLLDFDYIVEDSCKQKDTATITIEILQADCEFDFAIRTSPATCNRSDGSAELIINDSLDHDILWSTGDTTTQLTEITSGDYTVAVTVTDENGDTCTIEKGFDIPSRSQEILDTAITKNANCKGEGEMTLVIDSSQYDTVRLVLEGNGISIDTLVTGPGIDVHNWARLDSGTYTVKLVEPGLADSCQQELEIQIGQDTANFDIIITTEDAFCGAATGKARVRISPFGNYTYLWSTGDTGNEIENLSAGRYYIDVTSEETGCSRSDTFEIERDDAAFFIQDQIILPSACGQSGDIILELESPTGGNLRIVGTGPGVIINESSPPGSFRLSNFVTVNPGLFRLTIWDESVGMQCSERLDATVPIEDEDIDLQVIEVQEPSGPTASDGAILSEIVADPFSSPFLVFVNGTFNKTTTSAEFTIENLGVGSYTIYVISNTGCQSNEVEVEFDLSPFTLRLSNGSIFFTSVRPSSDADLTDEHVFFNQSISVTYSLKSLFEFNAQVYVGQSSNIFAIGGGAKVHQDKWNLGVGSRIYFVNSEQVPGMYIQGQWPLRGSGQFLIESVTLKDGLNWRVLLNGGISLNF